MGKKPVFKEYEEQKQYLFPPSYEEMVPKEHPVRVVNEVVDRINLASLYGTYKGGGTSSYDPRMLLKILIYGFVRNIYSSRKIEEAAKESVHFMWLSGGSTPDHNTIARFRSERLKETLKEVFVQVVKLLHEEGYISLKSITTDGTTIEANSNRYKIVWANNVKRYRKGIEKELRELWEYAEKIDAEDEVNPPTFEGISSERLEKTVSGIDRKLAKRELPADVKKKLNKAKKDWPVRMKKYEEQEQILNGRNSFSKTDTDATAMRQKDDHLRKAQLKPSYNVQLSTEDHWVVNYTIGQEHADTSAMTKHLDDWMRNYSMMPRSITADAGYGSEENYQYLENNDIDAFVKYNYFDREQKGKFQDASDFSKDKFEYDEETDTYTCPAGNPMTRIGTGTNITKNGYEQTYHQYKAAGCRGCPLRGPCIRKDDGRNRVIEVNHNMKRLRKKARDLLESEEGQEKRRNRYKVEAVIGNKKHNKNFRRFLLRGLEKTSIEMGLLSIAVNLTRLATKRLA